MGGRVCVCSGEGVPTKRDDGGQFVGIVPVGVVSSGIVDVRGESICRCVVRLLPLLLTQPGLDGGSGNFLIC